MSKPAPLSSDWLRRVRDEHYEATKHMTLEEIAAQTRRTADAFLAERGLMIDPVTRRLVPLVPPAKSAVSKSKKLKVSRTVRKVKPKAETRVRRKSA